VQKRIGMISSLALVVVIYLIWKDPNGMADLLSGFGHSVGGFFGDLWDKLGEFFSSLFGK
jgi:hypothetical protein